MFKKIHFLLLAVVLASGCVSVPRQAYNKEASVNIKKVVIADRADDETYETLIVSHPGMSFGLVGGLIAAADMQAKSTRLTTALDPNKTQLQHHFAEELVARLKEAGYEPELVQINKGLNEDATFAALQAKSKGDAQMFVDLRGKYVAAGTGSPYLPYVYSKIKLIAAGTSKVLYEDTITWGYHFNGSQTVHIDGGGTYHFDDIGALETGVDQARKGLYEGVTAIIAQITSDLKKN